MDIVVIPGGQRTLEDPENPCVLFVLGKIPWKTLKLHPTPEKLCSEAYFPCMNFWPCSAVAFFIPVMQRRRIYEVIGGKTAYHLSCGKQPLFPTTDKISCKTQNESWMGTGRRSIWDNYIFRKHSQINPGKSLKFCRKSPEKPYKRISFHCWPPWYSLGR